MSLQANKNDILRTLLVRDLAGMLARRKRNRSDSLAIEVVH
jgi:hypothetical protein